MKISHTLFFVLAAAAVTIALRFLPHPPNLVSMGALALLAGAVLPKHLKILVPLTVLFMTDMLIGLYNPTVMVAVYASFALYARLGWWQQRHGGVVPLVSATLAGSVLFFLITNAAVWAFTPWYTHDVAGLMLSYTLAIPFFKNTLVGDVAYTALFFGAYALVMHSQRVVASIRNLISVSKPVLLK